MSSQYVRDATLLSVRQGGEWRIEQHRYWYDDPDYTVADCLNGLWYHARTHEWTVEGGQVQSIATDDHTPGNSEPVPLDVGNVPTREYGDWYAWIIANPDVYELCLRAPSLNAWYRAGERINLRVPRPIRRWLWQRLHGQA